MELVIVIVVVGILAGIAAPTYLGALRQAKISTVAARMAQLNTAANIAYGACQQALTAGQANTGATIYPLTGSATYTKITLTSSSFYGAGSCFPSLTLLGQMAGNDGVFNFTSPTWTLVADSAFIITGTNGTTTTMPTFAASPTY